MISPRISDLMKYTRFLKGNYNKGIENLRTILTSSVTAYDLLDNDSAILVLFGNQNDRSYHAFLDVLAYYGYLDYAYNRYVEILGIPTGDTLKDTLLMDSSADSILADSSLSKILYDHEALVYDTVGVEKTFKFGMDNIDGYSETVRTSSYAKDYLQANAVGLTTLGIGSYTPTVGAKSIVAIVIGGGSNGGNSNYVAGSSGTTRIGEVAGYGGTKGEMIQQIIDLVNYDPISYQIGANAENTVFGEITALTGSTMASVEKGLLFANPRPVDTPDPTAGEAGDGVGAGGGGSAGTQENNRNQSGYGGWGAPEDSLYDLISSNATAQDGTDSNSSTIRSYGGVGSNGAVVLWELF